MDAIVAIPVKNEVERIGDCLRALDRQQGGHRTRVLLLLNDCTDGTAELVRAMRPALSVPVEILETTVPAAQAGAGFARRAAMERAAARHPGAALMTTDADGRVARDWVAANLFSLRSGADAVAGQAIIDPVEALAIPQTLHDADARECAYGEMLDRIAALLDPDPADPWPRHTEHSGASIAVTPAAYRRAGGIPAVALGEDREFFAALRRIDARIRHAVGVRVTVSGRIFGRAAGGMADTIRRRLTRPDPMLDDRLEPALNAARRAWMRHGLRRAWRRGVDSGPKLDSLATRLDLESQALRAMLDAPSFGLALEAVETSSPALRRVPVRTEDLPQETDIAARILDLLEFSPAAAADPADSPRFDFAMTG